MADRSVPSTAVVSPGVSIHGAKQACVVQEADAANHNPSIFRACFAETDLAASQIALDW